MASEVDVQERERGFNKTFRELDARQKIFTGLRLEALDRLSLQKELDALGRTRQGLG